MLPFPAFPVRFFWSPAPASQSGDEKFLMFLQIEMLMFSSFSTDANNMS